MHTPGPHAIEYAEYLGSPAYAIRAADGDLIAVGMLKGDAQLFAAAPALLSALEAAERVLTAMHKDGWKVGGDVLSEVRAALAQAEQEG